eukprot:INCI17566.7.p1 GENE.INCI17566.7~~INCI17566.7.p1  ORF type:complete len:110 (-),score=15.14 INCI17566.7:135-464(-)
MLTKGPLAAASQQLLLCLLLLASATARASNVTYYATPSKFADVGVFAFLPGFTLRDPTTAVFDPVTATWHVFCTHIHGRGANALACCVFTLSMQCLRLAANFDIVTAAF